MCWAEYTDGFLFVGRLDRDGMLVLVTVLPTDSTRSLPGETK